MKYKKQIKIAGFPEIYRKNQQHTLNKDAMKQRIGASTPWILKFEDLMLNEEETCFM